MWRKLRNFLENIKYKLFSTVTRIQYRPGLRLVESRQNLFGTSKKISLAHCIGVDCVQEANLKARFTHIVGGNGGKIFTGGLVAVRDRYRYVYYLVTKMCNWGPASYGSLRASLQVLRDHMRANEVTKLAIPRLGCGNDGLEWHLVKEEITRVFQNENVEIIVCSYDI